MADIWKLRPSVALRAFRTRPKLRMILWRNEDYSNFFNQIRAIIGKIAPCMTKKFKANTQKWFDGEVLENVNS